MQEEIISVLRELHNVTGFRISLHDEHFNEICAYPDEKLPFCAYLQKNKVLRARCIECDKSAFKSALENREAIIYTCPHGLTEAVSPLYNFGVLTGFLMMGQIISDKEFPLIHEKTEFTHQNDTALKELYSQTPKVKSELIKSYMKIMTICASYLTLSNAVQVERRGVAQNAKLYIELNLKSKLTIEDICEQVSCSKSTLTAAFKKEFSMTVNEFITHVRLERAKELLSTNKYSIGEVAEKTGFYDQSYFAKVFTAKYSKTPTQYKKTGGL